jgi:TonB family protein
MVRIGLSVLAVVSLAACGGGGKKEDTTPDESGMGDEGGGEDMSSGDGDMVPPEKMDAIQRTLDHRRDAASRCLTTAISEGKAEKNTRGKITVGMKITPDGRAKDVSIQKSSIESQAVQDCVVGVVQETVFDPLPKELDWSYTFAFEAF